MNARPFGVTSLPALVFSVALAMVPAAPAAVTVYTATLSGGAESPPNASAGTGTALVSIDPVAHALFVQVVFSGLTGRTTASHIHAATALPGVGTSGVATETPSFPNLPLGVTAGSFTEFFDTTLATSFNPAFVTANGGTPAGAEAALFAAIGSGRAYLNIHTTQFAGGEIRGFLTPAVPEPASWMLMLTGFGAAGTALRRRRRLLPA